MQDDRKTVYLDPFGLAKAWNKYRAHIIVLPSSIKACEIGFSAGYGAAIAIMQQDLAARDAEIAQYREALERCADEGKHNNWSGDSSEWSTTIARQALARANAVMGNPISGPDHPFGTTSHGPTSATS